MADTSAPMQLPLPAAAPAAAPAASPAAPVPASAAAAATAPPASATPAATTTTPGSAPVATAKANPNPAPASGTVPAAGGGGVARQPRVIVKSADMPEDMQRRAIELALTALDRFDLERDMAQFLKKEFDRRFQPSWHCIVGRHFGSFVTHDGSGFLYFYIEKTAILLFRSGQ